MECTKYEIMLEFIILITGVMLPLTLKWVDEMDSTDSEGVTRKFVHPFVQACCTSAGEMLCLVVFLIAYQVFKKRQDGSEDTHPLTEGSRTFNRFLLMAPAMFEITTTSISLIGLTLTYPSSYLMLQRSRFAFSIILGATLQNKNTLRREWCGMVVVIIGVVLVGLADLLGLSDSTKDTNSIITGNVLIIIAQVFSVLNLVIVEKFLREIMNVPALQHIGLRGCFGCTFLALLCIPFYFIPVDPPFSDNPRNVLEDALEAFILIKNNYLVGVALLGIIFLTAFYSLAFLVKERGKVSNVVQYIVRTTVVWGFSCAFFGQTFYVLQFCGFLLTIVGWCLDKGILFDRCDCDCDDSNESSDQSSE